ncbi:hypothetical protein [Mycobacterium angelicum]|uniref:Uncharacterized protein n=1 Tax=Mycobacterium angelicum TaxID=470074 RepID=A0A1W9ZA01_MYCAN|nr:hypothetical protein [Mycobacterium angelicum]MCV7199589.1 hypothetical protein [Mycobacterium angelicum]ORA10295.1 hypothetical protein BST12_26810 [Mycobacterium angelicum]
MTEAQARAAYDALKAEQQAHEQACPPIVPTEAKAQWCNAWARELNMRKTELETRLGQLGVQILPSGVEPAPDPSTPTG